MSEDCTLDRFAGEPVRSAVRWRAVRLPAEIDVANAEDACAALLAVIDEGTAVVIADLTETSFCDCAGVSALLSAARYAARAGSQLRIAARARPVLRMLDLTGTGRVVPVYRDLAAALGGAPPRSARRGATIDVLEFSSRRRTDCG